MRTVVRALTAVSLLGAWLTIPIPALAGRAVTYQDGARCEWLIEEPLAKTVCRYPSGGMRVCLWERVVGGFDRECFGHDRRTSLETVAAPAPCTG